MPSGARPGVTGGAGDRRRAHERAWKDDDVTTARETPRLSSPRRRRSVDAARRASLLQRAGEVLLDEGFTALTVDDLARRLRCSKSTLYGVAATKEQLVVAVTKRFFEDATRRVEAAVAAVDDPVTRIEVYLKTSGEVMARQSSHFFRDMVAYAPTADIYRLNSTAAARRVREIIEDGVRSGAFRDIHPEFAGHLVALGLEGIMSGRLQQEAGLSTGQAYAQLGDLLVKGLRTRG